MSTNAIMAEPKNLVREHKVVAREEWAVARRELLGKEKNRSRRVAPSTTTITGDS
jgi:predicted dithiol-disulfide oxidoreductase (DUF899 family)